MATAPDSDVVTQLVAAGIGLVSGTNLWRGPERAAGTGVPAKSVFVLASGGYPPRPFLGPSSTDMRRSTVQITVRSDAQDFDGGQTLVRAVRNAIHKAAVAGYVDIRVRESEPNYLGQDEAARHLWTVNVEMEHEQ